MAQIDTIMPSMGRLKFQLCRKDGTIELVQVTHPLSLL
jgi:hypothetical protein